MLVQEKTPPDMPCAYARQHTSSRLEQQMALLKTLSEGQQVVHHLHSHKGMLCNLFIILKLSILCTMTLLFKVPEINFI
jgi:hypothetical protein